MKLRYNSPCQTPRLRCSIMTISYRASELVCCMPASTAVAARLQAAFADLARGQADPSTMEETLRAIGGDAEASGASPAEVVGAFFEAADPAHAVLEPRLTAPLLASLLGAFETTRTRERATVGRLLRMQEE